MSSQGYNGLPAYYLQSSDPITPNVGFSLKGMDPIVAENFVLADTAIGTGGGGSKVKVNGSVINNPNFNGTTPSAPGGSTNVTWQFDGSGNISAYVSLGSSVDVNGSPVTNPNFNGTTPAAPTGYINAVWQVDGSGNVSTYVPLSSQGLDVPTAGQASPSPAYTYSEAPTTINPAIYVQDVNGQWHQQAGIDTTSATASYPPSGPQNPPGILTWTRRQFYRDTLQPQQTYKNSFMCMNHGVGIGTAQTNQDRILGGWMQNCSVVVTGGSISGGVVNLITPNISGWPAPGVELTPAGLSTLTQLNYVPLTLTQINSTNMNFVVAPIAAAVANNASAGNTAYAAYVNRPTNAFVGRTVVVAGFSHAANNGTFTVVANDQVSFTLNNPSGVSETPTLPGTITIQLSNQTFTGDSGNLDQYIYGYEGFQCEVDVVGTPSWTSAVDGEVTTFSGQMNLLNTGNISTPELGFNVIRADVAKSGAGQIGGSTIPVSAIQAFVFIDNTAPNGGTGFVGVGAAVRDAVGGAAGTIGYAFYSGYPAGSRVASANYGFYASDWSKSYTVTSVNNTAGGATVYNGPLFATTNALAGEFFRVTGLNSNNNGTFECIANTSTTLTLLNPSGTAQTATVQIEALADYAMYVLGGQVYFGGTLQLAGGYIDSTGAFGTSGQVLSSTGTATQWVTPSSGSGTVTTFSAGALSPLFTTTVANPTTTPALSFTLSNAGGGTVFGNNSTSSSAPAYTIAPVLGIPGSSTGSLGIASSTASGLYTITAPANAATPTLTLPTTSNVLAGQYAGDNVIYTSTLQVASAAGTLTPSLISQVKNTFLAGPTTGANANPTFRVIGSGDIPSGTVLWNQLGNASGNLTLSNTTFNSVFNHTSSTAWTWTNTTPTVTGAATTLALSASTAPTTSGSNVWTYTYAATESGSGSNGYVGASVTISGYTGGATGNNVTATITASTTTTFTITNATGTTTNTGTPVVISSAVVGSPIFSLSGTINSGVAGTLNSIADTWTIQALPGSVAPNPASALVFTHTGSSNTLAQLKAPMLFASAAGTSAACAIAVGAAGGGWGLYSGTGGRMSLSANVSICEFRGSGFNLGSGIVMGWSSAATPDNTASDTGLSRISAGLVGIGNATASDFTGSLQLANITQFNNTVATASTTNASPKLTMQANYWTGSSSAIDNWQIQTQLGVGPNASSLLNILHNDGTTGPVGVLIGNGFTKGVLSSPYLILSGSFEVSSSLNLFGLDEWQIQNVLGPGVEGTSTLAFTHTGTSGAAIVTMPALSAPVVVDVQVGTSYQAVAADANQLTTLNNASAITWTIPANSTVPFPVGTTLSAIQLGAGQVTITAAVGVTINTPSSLTTRTQYSTVSVVQVAANVWVAGGDLT